MTAFGRMSLTNIVLVSVVPSILPSDSYCGDYGHTGASRLGIIPETLFEYFTYMIPKLMVKQRPIFSTLLMSIL